MIEPYDGSVPNSLLTVKYMSHISNLAAASGHGEKNMGILPSCNNKEKRYDLHFLILLSKIFNFRLVVLYGYWDSDGLPHHSSDVFSHGASISDRVGGVGALYLSNSYGFVKSSYFSFTLSTGVQSCRQLGNVTHM